MSRGTSANYNRNRVDRVVTACGCLVLPDAVAILDPKTADCAKHGQQAVLRKAGFREIAERVYQIVFPVDSPGEPPF